MHTPMGSERRSIFRQQVCWGERSVVVCTMNQVHRDLELVEAGGMWEGNPARMEIEALRHVAMSEPSAIQGVENIRKQSMDDGFFDCHAFSTWASIFLGINAQLIFQSRHGNGNQ